MRESIEGVLGWLFIIAIVVVIGMFFYIPIHFIIKYW